MRSFRIFQASKALPVSAVRSVRENGWERTMDSRGKIWGGWEVVYNNQNHITCNL